MTGIALSIALVVVAFVARDVVLRVVGLRQRGADVMQVAKALDSETQRLSETRAEVSQVREDFEVFRATIIDELHTTKGEVAVLKTTSSLRGPR